MLHSIEGLDLLNTRIYEAGSGYGSRHVYAIDERTVVKLPAWKGDDANDCEFQLWLAVQDTEWADYFFPCIDIVYQPDGAAWLLMERATYIPKPTLTEAWDWSYTHVEDRLAADHLYEAAKKFQIPDVKPQNVGIRQDGKWSILDYGMSVLPKRLPRRRKSRVACVR